MRVRFDWAGCGPIILLIAQSSETLHSKQTKTDKQIPFQIKQLLKNELTVFPDWQKLELLHRELSSTELI